MKIQAIRGTKDILPADAPFFRELETAARGVFSQFGFQEIRTPTFEAVELFQRAMGDTTDVVQKEMYVFEDRGGRKISLRPEGTAGVVRAFVEHHLDQTAPFCKLFYIGPMFRAERPQAGRFREFWQIGAESFGTAAPTADAELLLMIQGLFDRLRLKDVTLKLNSLGCSDCRPTYTQALVAYVETHKATLCEDCLRRMAKNPLRLLDCKIDGSKFADAPTIDVYWCEPCREHFTAVKTLVSSAGGRFELAPRLVRGLDYYTRTVFEFTSGALGSQDAIAAGGRYDKLVKQMDGPDVPALGFALGAERVIAVRVASVADKPESAKTIFVAAHKEVRNDAFALLQRLRSEASLRTYVFEGGLFDKKLGKQLEIANKIEAVACLILGEDEVKAGTVTVRRLSDGHQESVSLSDLTAKLPTLL
jgi:histidyl-tRNA synthetase